ncbi:thyrotropin subunit beta-like [Heterodontus francisci]|uniref:thyrotropin subunit beta-like n=1 Tax=Heterodontus francisci TaxID=7792 RepID=UPI00355C0B32
MNALCLLPLVLFLSCRQVGSQCSVTRYVSYVEKEECSYCMAINTTICAGFCMSRDVNTKSLLPKIALIQRVCTYQDVKYISIKLPGCPADVDPFYRFPVILSCVCSQCATDTTDCVNGIDPPFYCTKPQWSIPASRSRILLLYYCYRGKYSQFVPRKIPQTSSSLAIPHAEDDSTGLAKGYDVNILALELAGYYHGLSQIVLNNPRPDIPGSYLDCFYEL